MSFTGGFALALPAPLTARKRAALSLDPADLAIVQDPT